MTDVGRDAAFEMINTDRLLEQDRARGDHARGTSRWSKWPGEAAARGGSGRRPTRALEAPAEARDASRSPDAAWIDAPMRTPLLLGSCRDLEAVFALGDEAR